MASARPSALPTSLIVWRAQVKGCGHHGLRVRHTPTLRHSPSGFTPLLARLPVHLASPARNASSTGWCLRTPSKNAFPLLHATQTYRLARVRPSVPKQRLGWEDIRQVDPRTRRHQKRSRGSNQRSTAPHSHTRVVVELCADTRVRQHFCVTRLARCCGVGQEVRGCRTQSPSPAHKLETDTTSTERLTRHGFETAAGAVLYSRTAEES